MAAVPVDFTPPPVGLLMRNIPLRRYPTSDPSHSSANGFNPLNHVSRMVLIRRALANVEVPIVPYHM